MARKRDDKVYWVVSKRQYFFGWKAYELYKTKKAAEEAKVRLEGNDDRMYKVERVELVG